MLLNAISQVWDRHTGLLIKDLPDLHTGRIFSVVGDKTKVISSGIDQVRLSLSSHSKTSFAYMLCLAENCNLGFCARSGYQFCRHVASGIT